MDSYIDNIIYRGICTIAQCRIDKDDKDYETKVNIEISKMLEEWKNKYK